MKLSRLLAFTALAALSVRVYVELSWALYHGYLLPAHGCLVGAVYHRCGDGPWLRLAEHAPAGLAAGAYLAATAAGLVVYERRSR